ncbi:hypothetical protein CEXT_142641 [Caerostris extrusa]|uniref:Uncharacterized protein n=1 Tax=Caerostris extrusa TaxID=172846 RepID=A0AAV4Y882_CAEEX|nr:hypothetical protein CEXT_142641 [Caerostris extrusa]
MLAVHGVVHSMAEARAKFLPVFPPLSFPENEGGTRVHKRKGCSQSLPHKLLRRQPFNCMGEGGQRGVYCGNSCKSGDCSGLHAYYQPVVSLCLNL